MDYSLRHIKKLLKIIKAKKMSVPKDFFCKTPQWIRRHYNGIGAEWMPSICRKFITKALGELEPVALVHDIDFLTSQKSYWRFTTANLRFWLNASKVNRFFLGGACAALCQFFGWSAFRDGKESMAYFYYYTETGEHNGIH